MNKPAMKLLGGFELRDSLDSVQRVPNIKDRALLTYLALDPDRPRSRGHLAGLLWGDQTEDKARHSLSQSLSSICKRLGPDQRSIRRAKHDVGLDASALDVDVLRFLQLCGSTDRAELKWAALAYDNEFLNDLDDCGPEFENWTISVRGQYERLAISAAKAFLSTVGHDEEESCIAVAEAILRIDPTDEFAHRSLICSYGAIGQSARAKTQYENCTAILSRELGIAPMPETLRAADVAVGVRTQSNKATDPGAVSVQESHLPSIAVYTLDTDPNDPNLAVLAEGLIDDITTAMTRYRSLFVISHDSTMQFDAAAHSVPEFCQRLGVRYGLCGHARWMDLQLRVNLRLVEASTGQSLWSERFTLAPEELAAFPDQATDLFVARVAGWLENDALIRTRRKPFKNWAAYDHLLQGNALHQRSWYNTRNVVRAIAHFERAIELEPDNARAFAYLACSKSTPWFKDRDNAHLNPSTSLAQHALDLDQNEPEAHRVLGAIHLTYREHDLADAHFMRARELYPGHADTLAHSSRLAMHTGALQESRQQLNQARQLNPLYSPWYHEHLAVLEFQSEDYSAALGYLTQLGRGSFYDHIYMAASLAHLGKLESAKSHACKLIAARPDISLATVHYFLPYKLNVDLDRVLDGLKHAGLK